MDDDPDTLGVLRVVFRRAGLDVETSDSGLDALELLGRRQVDIIVCDLGMRPTSGLDLIRLVRAQPWGGSLPMVLMTGTAGDEALVPALQAGADDFITKPIKADELVARVRSHLRSASRWSAAVEAEIGGRVDVLNALGRVPISPDPVDAAVRIVGEIARTADLEYASIYQVTPEQTLRALATFSRGGVAEALGAAVVPAREAYLIAHAREGPFAEIRPRRWRDEAAQGFWTSRIGIAGGAPIFHDDEMVAVLFAATAIGAGSPRIDRARLVAALTDYATVVSLRLGSVLATTIRRDLERLRFSDMVTGSQFSIAYQPIVRLASGIVVGYEALCRFHDGERPEVRFAEATAAGYGPAFEVAVMQSAIRGAQHLPPEAFVAINLSPGAILLDRHPIEESLAAADRRVVIEVSENAQIANYEEFRRSMASLDADLAVDDAGAGYASLRHILELRPRFAKLDISLVRGLDADPVRRALVAGLVHYAAGGGFDLVAEGVEEQAEADVLVGLGVALGQGYLFGRPKVPSVSKRGSTAGRRPATAKPARPRAM